MLKINCPFCGARDEQEFRYGGPSHVTRPGPHDAVSDSGWSTYLYARENPMGWHYERWHHAAGCRQWFNVSRHTVTQAIRVVYPASSPKPDLCNGDAP